MEHKNCWGKCSLRKHFPLIIRTAQYWNRPFHERMVDYFIGTDAGWPDEQGGIVEESAGLDISQNGL